MTAKAAACLAATTSAALYLGKPLGYAMARTGPARGRPGRFSRPIWGAEVLFCLAGATLAFLAQCYYGLRVLFDAHLFAQLAARLSAEDEADTLATELGHLDQALYSLKLAPNPAHRQGV